MKNTIQITKKTTSRTDQVKLALDILCLLNDIDLSKTEKMVLTYFVVYKVSEKTDKLLLDSQIVKTIESLRNIKSKLTKLGFLLRSEDRYKSYELNLNSDFSLDKTIHLDIKLDNS